MSSETTITVGELARRLGISRSTAYALANSGLIRPTRVGRALRLVERDVDAFIRNGGTRPIAAKQAEAEEITAGSEA